jgi:hypothetical protein
MLRRRFWLLSTISTSAVLLLGCGSNGTPEKNSHGPGTATGSGGSPSKSDGLQLVGLKYSPGGSVLPHPDEPFDPVTNNPYAVRCIDAMPDYKTRYQGDEFCILPPPPDQGVQVGVHPQGADYWARMQAGDYSAYADAAATKAFEVEPGTEVVQTYDNVGGNAEAHDYFRLDARMRSGSHHLVSWFNTMPGKVEGWEPVTADEFGGGLTTSWQLYNVQSTHSDRPAAADIPQEDDGLGATFPASSVISMQLHHINTTLEPLLREVWINIWWLPGDAKAVAPVNNGVALASIDYPPNQVIDNVGTYAPSKETRVVSIFGHRHAWTTRFSAELVRASGETQEMYDSFDWLEMPTYQLDSVTRNPPPDVAAERDGAISGLTVLHPGDQIKFHCHVDTTVKQAQKLEVAVPSKNLGFANQAIAGEMCVLYLETSAPPPAPVSPP